MKPSCYRLRGCPQVLPVKRRENFAAPSITPARAIVVVDRATECHATPPEVAARMVRYLGALGPVLEPSAGTGNLSQALLDAGLNPDVLVQVERHHALAAGLRKFGPVANECFLEYAERMRGKVAFPHIIMNPPFSQVRRHVAAARSLLGHCGHDRATLVALVPCTFDTDGAETLEHLDDTTFPTARVRTKIIRIQC